MSKKFILLLFLICGFCSGYSQKIALLHKSYKQPIIYTDSVTAEQIASGYFPLEVSNVDTFYANIQYINNILKERQRSKMEAFELRSGNTIIEVNRVLYAYGDRFNVVAKTKIGEIASTLVLTTSKVSNAKGSELIQKLLGYINSNKSLFTGPNEIHPKIYNVQIVTQ